MFCMTFLLTQGGNDKILENKMPWGKGVWVWVGGPKFWPNDNR